MIDTHCHVQFKTFNDDYDAVIQRCYKKNTILNIVGTQIDTSKRAVELAEKYDGVYASVGLHPEHLFSKRVDEEETSFISREEKFDYDSYKKLARHPKVIGIGECGIDLYRLPAGLTTEQVLPRQREVFLQHIKLAKEVSLPLVIHCREAHSQLIDVLRQEIPRLGGVGVGSPISGTMHCYTSNWANAEQYLTMGLYFGFTGVITFPPQKNNPQAQIDLLEVVKRLPLDRILLETDCPYLAPIPYRGKRGEPWMIEETAKKIAEIRGLTFDEVIAATTKNALRLFTKISPA